MEIICFHNPDEENGFLSNWFPSTFVVDDIVYSSMEQYMMYQKAILFDDKVIAKEIIVSDDVSRIKELGRLVNGYNDGYWSGVRQIIVYKGLIAKFSQHKELQAKLEATGNAILAECAVRDNIWGIGLSMKDPNRFDRTKWRGKNLLGYTLMMVREKIKN